MNDEKYYKDLAEKIEKKYDNELVAKILPYEEERINLVRKKGIIVVTGALSLVPIILYFMFPGILIGISVWIPIISFFVICIILTALYFVFKSKEKNFKYKVKKAIMPFVCECFPDIKWIEKRENHTNLYKKAAVLPNFSEISLDESFSEISYDDYFEGKYENTDFSIEEVKITISENTYLYRYGGVIISCSMNKKSKCHTIIHPFIMTNKSPVENLHYTKLEDVIFENNYNVYTDDDVEARYLITPSFMEKINNVKSMFFAEKMYVAFYEGNFYLMLLMQIGGRINFDLFEPANIYIPLDNNKRNFNMMLYQILAIYKLIDYFKLTQDIGM